MANSAFTGFRFWGSLTGGNITPATFVQEVANNYATALGVGDVIIPVSDGTIAVAANNSTTLLGVITGVSYIINGRREFKNYLPANTTFSPTTVGSRAASLVSYIPFSPDFIFEVDGNAAAPTATAAGVVGLIGENCALATGTADSTTGMSGMTLDLSTHVTTAQQFRIVGLPGYTLQGGWDQTDTDPTLTHAKFLVTCNQGVLPPYTTSGV